MTAAMGASLTSCLVYFCSKKEKSRTREIQGTACNARSIDRGIRKGAGAEDEDEGVDSAEKSWIIYVGMKRINDQ